MATMTLTAIEPKLRPPTCIDERNCVEPQGSQMVILFAGLALMSIGAGGIRPCNIAFGADQFDTTTNKGREQLESFFDWCWIIGFAIPTGCFFLSIVIFIIGHRTYIIKRPQGSVFVDMFKVITAAIRKGKLTASGNSFYDPDHLHELEPKLSRTGRFSCLDKAALIADQTELDDYGKPKNDWRLCSVQQVENLKLLLGMTPVWITGICCFITMDQQGIIGILQAIQTTKTLGTSFQIPPAWIGLSSMIALAIWVFIYEQNLGASDEENNRKGQETVNVAEDERLIEASAAVALMEFLTTQLPESMRTVAGAIFFVSLSIASYLNSILVNVVYRVTSKVENSPWLGAQDLNEDRSPEFPLFHSLCKTLPDQCS
ncbi:hypothetical protein PTKIN_Ptkin06aG0016300 [Pterospermum kingtungense]